MRGVLLLIMLGLCHCVTAQNMSSSASQRVQIVIQRRIAVNYISAPTVNANRKAENTFQVNANNPYLVSKDNVGQEQEETLASISTGKAAHRKLPAGNKRTQAAGTVYTITEI